MGIADSTINMVMNKFIPGGSAMGLTLLGTSAGVSGVNEVIKNGGTIDNAVRTGIASGIAEALFEKISLEQLSAFRASGKAHFVRLLVMCLKVHLLKARKRPLPTLQTD